MEYVKKMVVLTSLVLLLSSLSGFGSPERKNYISAALAAEKPVPVSGTEEYLNAWTFPEAKAMDETPDSITVDGDRQRMIADDTDEYLRTWNLPDEAGEKKPAARLQSPPPKVVPTGDTEDYINGWTFE